MLGYLARQWNARAGGVNQMRRDQPGQRRLLGQKLVQLQPAAWHADMNESY